MAKDEHGVAHHGPPILTEREYQTCNAMLKWIETARNSGGFGYGPDWLPTSVDIIKSRLFWRIRSGKEPLEYPPPRAYSCPWYEVVEDGKPHSLWEGVYISKDLALHEGKPIAIIAQCGYAIDRMNDKLPLSEPEVVGYGPWRFKVWKQDDDWFIQCINPPTSTSA